MWEKVDDRKKGGYLGKRKTPSVTDKTRMGGVETWFPVQMKTHPFTYSAVEML